MEKDLNETPDNHEETCDEEELKRQIEELKRSAESLNTCDILDEKDKESNESIERYEIPANRKSKTKVVQKNRHLGYHRDYLKSGVKIKHVILFILIILASLLCISKLMPAADNLGYHPDIAEVDKFGANIDIIIQRAIVKDDNVIVDIKIKNGEDKKINYNPSSFLMEMNDDIFAASILDDDSQIYANGLASGKSAVFTLKFKVKDAKSANSVLLISRFKADAKSCRIQSQVTLEA